MKTYKFIDGMHSCMILSVNAPNDPGPEYVLADEAMNTYNLGRDKGWSAGYHEGQVELASYVIAKEACITQLTARNAELEAEVARLKADAEYMQWMTDNAEIVTTGQGMRVVTVLNVFGNNNWSLRDYLSMEINGTMHGIASGLCKCGPFHGVHHATCKAVKS